MASRDELRKVKVSQYSDGSGAFNISGYFHQWGSARYLTDNGGALTVTVGIIELEDGNVKQFEPFRIKFVEEF